MFLGPCQIMWKLNGLSVKIYSTKVTYFGNTRSKVGDLACHLLIIFVWFINQVYFAIDQVQGENLFPDSFYTNIPNNEGIKAVERTLKRKNLQAKVIFVFWN